MKADPKGVLTGAHYLDGDFACAEGALAAGCRFVAGYPITPSTEVVERISRRFPTVGGTFIQMEDELASMAAVVGGAWTGSKSMTVTSGPGFSLMMENIGLAAMMEMPCVVVDVQQEAFDFTVDAFNLAEIYRTPVLVMLDECVGHMTEKVVIPDADEIEITPRTLTTQKPGEYQPYKVNGGPVPEFARVGDGYRFHATALTHDERGYPVMSAEGQERCVRRLVQKIRDNADDIVRYEQEQVEGAEVIVISYGITARVAQEGLQMARQDGVRVGHVRLVVAWPFPEKLVRALAPQVKAFVVPEINCGQMVLEVERCAAGKAAAVSVPHPGGGVHDPQQIRDAVLEAAR